MRGLVLASGVVLTLVVVVVVRSQFQIKPDVRHYYCRRREDGRRKEETYKQVALEGLRPNVTLVFRERGECSMFRWVRVVLNYETKVPTKPPSNVEEVRNQYDQTLVQRLEEVKSLRLYFTCSAKNVITCKHFGSRPIWTRAALLSQFTPAQAREIHKFVPIHQILQTFLTPVTVSSKVLLPLTCYVFGDGPWRDTMVRFGYDPRQDPQARLLACVTLTFSRC